MEQQTFEQLLFKINSANKTHIKEPPRQTIEEKVFNIVSNSKTKERGPSELFQKKHDVAMYHPSTAIDATNGDTIRSRLATAINDVESLRSNYNEARDIWTLDFGTKPIQKTIDPYDRELLKIVNSKQWLALRVAIKMLEKHEYLRDYDDDGIFKQMKWFLALVSICYDETINKIVVDYVFIDGDKSTFYYIKNAIEKDLLSIM
jgi:hypothetical protein